MSICVVFMDCDGVINSDDFLTEWIASHGDTKESMLEFKRSHCIHDGHDGYVVPELVGNLKSVCERTNCRIVWSSSWRENYLKKNPDSGDFFFDFKEIRSLWKAKGFPIEYFLDCTPCENCSRYSYVPRGVEIQMWIDANKERYNIGRMAVLDDNEDAGIGLDCDDAKFFQTTFKEGLTRRIADEVVEWLNNEGNEE